MIYLAKILPLFVLPLGVSLMLLCWGLLRKRRWPIATACVVLWLAGLPAVSGRLVRYVEGGAIRRTAADAPTAQAIVVLSEGRVVAPGPAHVSEWADGDRFFGGVELWHAGRAPLLVFTGNWLPWQPDAPLEGEVLAQFAQSMGVPADDILVTGRVSNTADEARAVAALLASRTPGRPTVLLVTSAFHMDRAARLFTASGVTVERFPVDFAGDRAGGFNILNWLPTAGALSQSQTALREIYGIWYYRVIGTGQGGA